MMLKYVGKYAVLVVFCGADQWEYMKNAWVEGLCPYDLHYYS